MSFNIYQGSSKKTNVSTLYANLTDLVPATTYVFSITETDGADESAKSNNVTVVTNGRLTIPSIKEIVSVRYCVDPIGIESDGFGNGVNFGGTIPVDVSILKNTVSGINRILEVESAYHMSEKSAVLVETNKYLIIDGNRSMEIITK